MMEIRNRTIYAEDCLKTLSRLPDSCIDLIYLDPPFNSNSTYNLPFKKKGNDKQAVRAFVDTWTWNSEREGKILEKWSEPGRNRTEALFAQIVELALQISTSGSGESLAAYLVNMAERLLPMRRVLKPTGSIYLHCDQTASHYLKVLMDSIFGRKNFRNEIVWGYGLGGSSKRFWSRKHDIIFFYTMSKEYHFDKPTMPATSIRMRGQQKGMLDYWTDIPTINNMARERTGYPTQKPLALLERIIKASSNEDDLVLDPFCGCGTALHAAETLGRKWLGIDISRFSSGLVQNRLLDNFDHLTEKEIFVENTPSTEDDVRQWISRARQKGEYLEIEKWACGRVGARGMYQREPGDAGPDGGIDGVIEFAPWYMDRTQPTPSYAIVQVKAGKVKPNDVRALYQTVKETPRAKAGVLLCYADQLNKVNKNRSKETYGDRSRNDWPVIQGLSMQDMLNGKRPELPYPIFRKDARMSSMDDAAPVAAESMNTLFAERETRNDEKESQETGRQASGVQHSGDNP